MPSCATPETCPPPPPYAPPARTPELEAATRTRYEAEARARHEAEVRSAVAAQIDARQRAAWIERGRVPERDPVPLGWPFVQTAIAGGAEVGASLAHKDGGTWMVDGTTLVRLAPESRWALDVGGGIATLAPEHETRYRALTLEGGALWCVSDAGNRRAVHTGIVWARGAVQLGLPIDGGARTPDALLSFKASVETDLFVARFGDGGFATAVLDIGAVLRVPVGGESNAARLVTFGPQVLAGAAVAF